MSSLAYGARFLGKSEHARVGSPLRLEVREGFGLHEVAILDLPTPRATLTRPVPEETPVEIQWGWGPQDFRLFQGYVNHPEVVEGDNGAFVRYMCIGTSRPLNTPSLSSWGNVSASYVAKRVAEKHGLRAVLSKHPEVLPYVTAGNGSDFALLKDLADRVGYRFWITGGTLYFVDPMTLVRRSRHAPLIEMNSAGGAIRSMDILSGSLVPRRAGHGSVKRIYGINQTTGRLLQSSSSKAYRDLGVEAPSGRQILTGSVGSVHDARVLAANDAAKVEWVTAKADIYGHRGIRVGGLVDVGGTRLRPEVHGNWLVSGMVHVIEPSESHMIYHAELDLARNSLEDVVYRESDNVSLGGQEVTSSLVSGEFWESEIKGAVYV